MSWNPVSAVVVPCYEEAARLDVPRIIAFLQSTPTVRLVFVDDGSKDGTFEVLEGIRSAHPDRADVLRLVQNSGKAEAVRQGILRASESGAEFIGYWDADLATPLEVILDFERELIRNPSLDLVMGARVALLGRNIQRQLVRHYLGRVFATAASIALNLTVFDTQCGAKLLRVSPRTISLFADRFGSRWVFDVELLARYLVAGGTSAGLCEFPLLAWTDVEGSKVKPSDFFRAIGELASIYRRYPLKQPMREVVMPLSSRFARYLAVGGAGTALHYGVLILSVELFHVPAVWSAVLGASVGAIANYFMNYHFTFVSKAPHSRAFLKFVAVAVLGMVLSGAGVRWGVEQGLHYLVAQVLSTIVFLILGFFLNRAWTF